MTGRYVKNIYIICVCVRVQSTFITHVVSGKKEKKSALARYTSYPSLPLLLN
jgi:hypothetical protein